MMGRLTAGQAQFFYAFHLDEVVPADHVVRRIDAVLDVGWIHQELAPFYSNTGRPSIDPELMIRMLLVGYVFAIRSERRICAEVQVNLAYRWLCGLSIEDPIPDKAVRPSWAAFGQRRRTESHGCSNNIDACLVAFLRRESGRCPAYARCGSETRSISTQLVLGNARLGLVSVPPV